MKITHYTLMIVELHIYRYLTVEMFDYLSIDADSFCDSFCDCVELWSVGAVEAICS